jgi:hypothetical protein
VIKLSKLISGRPEYFLSMESYGYRYTLSKALEDILFGIDKAMNVRKISHKEWRLLKVYFDLEKIVENFRDIN